MSVFPPQLYVTGKLHQWTDMDLAKGLANFPGFLKEEVLRYRRHEDRIRTLAGKCLLQKALRDLAMDTDLSCIQKHPDTRRPEFTDAPVFSISHAGNMAVCVLSSGPVGVDIEPVRPIPLSDFKRVFTKKETRSVEEATDSDAAFFAVWTRKEAVLKATGKGLLHPASSVETGFSPVVVDGISYFLHPVFIEDAIACHMASTDRTPPALIRCRKTELLP